MTEMEPYTKGRELFAKWCHGINSAIPIEFGTVGCPGLSDIDIGIVFKETFDLDRCNLRSSLLEFPEKTKELMNGGTLMFFPEAIFKHILLVDDIQVKCLSDNIDIEKVADSDKYLVDLVQIIEWLPERIAKIYLELKNKDTNCRRLIGSFYSLCYSLEKIQKHAGKNEKLNSFIEQVNDLRKEWFSLDEKDVSVKLKDLSNSYISVFAEAVRNIMPILDKHFKVCGLAPNYNLYKNVNFVFSQEDIGILDIDDSIYINIPSAFLCTYIEYSKYDSQLGSIIAQRIGTEGASITVSEEMSDILKRRAHIFSSLFDFVKELNCKTGLYKFGWYLNE